MLWVKRIVCGISALIILILGVHLYIAPSQIIKIFGFLLCIGGITLLHISITQGFPKYNFWITLVAIYLGFSLYTMNNKSNMTIGKTTELHVQKSNSVNSSTEENKPVKKLKKKKKSKKSNGFNPFAYPKISGSIQVIDAHVFYINGRYVRLYGVDAPDNDQICSDANGETYNCGQSAISWVRSWIDNNSIDCYILKIEPKGKDLAVCVWGEYDIGAALVESGWAIANYQETDIYAPYEVKAKNSYSGLWQGTFYSPADWRNIKMKRNNFTIKRRKSSSGFFNFKSWF